MNEKKIIAQADNCVGQNRKQICFLVLRLLNHDWFCERGEAELPSCRTYQILLWLVFWTYNTTDTTLPEDFQRIGNEVSQATALLYGQKGKSWAWYDWKSFLTGNFLKIVGLTKFFIYKLYKGDDDRVYITCRTDIDDQPVEFALTPPDGVYFDAEPVPVKSNDFLHVEPIIWSRRENMHALQNGSSFWI